MKKILCYGVWDLFHRGHLEFLIKAKKIGNFLIVGVLNDSLAKWQKRRPIYNEKDRLAIMGSLKMVDMAVLITRGNYRLFMTELRPDYVAHGSDNKNAPSILLSRELGIKTKIIPYYKGMSTTDIIEECKYVKS